MLTCLGSETTHDNLRRGQNTDNLIRLIIKITNYLRNTWVLKASDILRLVQAISHKNGRRHDLGLLLITCNNLVSNYNTPSKPSALLSLVAKEDR